MQPTIIQISSVYSHELNNIQVMGLSDDGKVYVWVYGQNKWEKF